MEELIYIFFLIYDKNIKKFIFLQSYYKNY